MYNEVIKSTDVNATEKLEAKIAKLKNLQERMRNANKAIRLKDVEKGNAQLKEQGFTEQQIKDLRTPDFCGRLGFPSYALQNNNANIRRLEERLAEIRRTRNTDTEALERQTDLYRFFVDDNRCQFEFDGKPEENVRSLLKSNGFKWSHTRSTWVRQFNDNGMRASRYVMSALDAKAGA